MRTILTSLSLTLAFVAAPVVCSGAALTAAEKQEATEVARKPIGEQTIGGVVIAAAVVGEIKPGAESEIKLTIKSGKPAAVRGWIGVENGKGSAKAKAHAEDGGLCCDAEAPNPLPEGARFWLEVEGADGAKALGSFALPK
jgi:hypothetical protein